MWRRPVEPVGTAVLYPGLVLVLVLVLSHLVGEGSVVKVLGQPGRRVTLPCWYHYEDQTPVSQLSVQWRSPHNQLLCHYIKHKSYQNCSAGYAIAYRPGSIALTVQHVGEDDFGLHVCSVSKRHEFSDSSVELARMSDHFLWIYGHVTCCGSYSITSAPSGGNQAGPNWSLVLLPTVWIVYL